MPEINDEEYDNVKSVNQDNSLQGLPDINKMPKISDFSQNQK